MRPIPITATVTVTVTHRGRALARRAMPAYRERSARLVEALPGGADGPVLAEALNQWLTFFEPDSDGAPVLGVAVAPPAEGEADAVGRRAAGVAGILILGVHDETPAARAGLARGDLISAVAGVEVGSVADLERALRGVAPGGEVTLQVLRGAEPREVAVTIS